MNALLITKTIIIISIANKKEGEKKKKRKRKSFRNRKKNLQYYNNKEYKTPFLKYALCNLNFIFLIYFYLSRTNLFELFEESNIKF